ncbi:MAG: hypothetical protein MPJ83_04075 [Gammaproteobacteria bacterium]|nr:hypothetical protein [Gammaproteobacteria bacterium]
MELDLRHIATAKARRKNARGGMDYLLSAVRRELEERWRAARGEISPREAPQKMLLLDFAGGDFDAGADAEVIRISPPETPGVDLHFGARGEFDGVVMCLQPAWLDWGALLEQARRALREGGALLFCTFGPDTLAQIRDAWRRADDAPHVHPFPDMHEIGDQLLRGGFVRPVVDADRVTVEYEDAGALHADLRREGFTNILRARRKTLTGAARAAKYRRALSEARAPNGMLGITYELIYGAATAPSSSLRVAPPRR